MKTISNLALKNLVLENADREQTQLAPDISLVEKGRVQETLDGVADGRTVEVSSVSDQNPSLSRKLAAMGIVSGGELKVLGRAPLGCPISVSTLGYQLSLRLSEASQILVAER